MKKEKSDEQFDHMMQKLVNGFALDESTVNDIADSPSLWWSVQRGISAEKSVRSPWPPVRTWRRWLWIGLPTAAAVLIVLAFVIGRGPAVNNDLAAGPVAQPQPMVAAPSVTSVETAPRELRPMPAAAKHIQKSLTAEKPALRKAPSTVKMADVVAAAKRAEIKTDFIALSYARDPDSGQVVRVRVPSSMMVTLGLVTSVKKPNEMVDAEVLVGDDGLSRAIRFIR
jgi:hypothetical protein